jgi:opacity protein-like surface antigen
MKKALIAACVALVFCLAFTTQAVAQTEFGVGPIVGINFSSTSISPDPVYPAGYTKGGRTMIMFGAQAEVGFAKMFYIVLQPTYEGKGYEITGPAGSVTVSGNELDLPLLFKVKFLQGVIRPYAFAGPDLGFVLTATRSYSITGLNRPDEDLKSNTASTDFAIDFGGGAEYNVMPKLGITLDVRYSLGLSNMAKPPAGDPSETDKVSGFQIFAGVMFHI